MSSAPPKSAPQQPTSWTWPHPPLPNRYNACVTEIMDLAADGRRVAVIEGSIWPAVGSQVTVRENEIQLRASADGSGVGYDLVMRDDATRVILRRAGEATDLPPFDLDDTDSARVIELKDGWVVS